MIEIKNINFSYKKDEQVLKNVDLTINKGEWISIVGHNGSGKSTLSKLLIGLQELKDGSIIVDGLELNKKNVNEIRKKIGIVFQNPDNQFVGVTVKHDIAFGLENRNVERETMKKTINEVLKIVSMENHENDEPHNLSGGQKQRVAIASILSLNTDYIIFDEATSMLDPKGVADITELIKQIHQNTSKTIITITHNLDLAKYSDRIAVLKEGSLIALDKPINIFQNKELLEGTKLCSPFYLDAYLRVVDDCNLKNNKELAELLWQLNLKM